jgi:feruloyl esterase
MKVNSTASTALAIVSALGIGIQAPQPAISAQRTAQGISAASPLTCDESLKTRFRPDALTRVTLVHAFHAGEDLSLVGKASTKAAADMCVVKLTVGPGFPGPPDAPSTSDGIGIEIWLPAKPNWNGRVHLIGGGGWAGEASIKSPTQVATRAAALAAAEGSVSAVTDTGHSGGDGAFGWTPDGKLNTTLWRDFSARGIHEMAVKAKALATAFYGTAPHHAYWDGCSTGGRQGLKLVQDYPDDVDGALILAPAINWSRFITAELYPQVVMLQDLGAPIAQAKLQLVSAAAVSHCDSDLNGQHDGFISHPDSCRYDPRKDARVLCASDGGSANAPNCVSKREAEAINKIWYGQTSDGSAPDPEVANGFEPDLGGKRLWFGLSRGTIPMLAGSKDGSPMPFFIATRQVAYNLGNQKLDGPDTPAGIGWQSLTYADLARAQQLGVAKQPMFGNINTDKTDLRAFKRRGGKVLMAHGLADMLIFPQGTRRYYNQVVQRMGGLSATQGFFRYFEVPGWAHCGLAAGSVNGLEGVSPPADPPLQTPQQLFDALVAWTEHRQAPTEIVVRNKAGSVSRPLCMYPKSIAYGGGDRAKAESYTCTSRSFNLPARRHTG